MFRSRRRRFRPKMYWMGNQTGITQGSTPITHQSFGGTTVGFQLQLFSLNSPTMSAVADVMQFGARIRRMVGEIQIRATSSTNGAAAFLKYFAGIQLLEQARTGSGAYSNVEGGVDQTLEYVDVWSTQLTNNSYYAMQRRWLWWRMGCLASSNSLFAADYPSTTQSFLTPQKAMTWDVKCNVPLAPGGTQPRSYLPVLLFYWAQPGGQTLDTGLALEIDYLVYRCLYNVQSQFGTRR